MGDRRKTNKHINGGYNVIHVKEVQWRSDTWFESEEWVKWMWEGSRQREQQVSRTWTEWGNWERKGSRKILEKRAGDRYQAWSHVQPAVSVLRANSNLWSSVGSRSVGEKGVGISWPDVHFGKKSQELWEDQLGATSVVFTTIEQGTREVLEGMTSIDRLKWDLEFEMDQILWYCDL